MKTITISIASDTDRFGGTFKVEQDGKFHEGMTWDEMLGQIAAITIHAVNRRRAENDGALYPMQSEEEWADEAERREEIRAERDANPPTTDDDIPW